MLFWDFGPYGIIFMTMYGLLSIFPSLLTGNLVATYITISVFAFGLNIIIRCLQEEKEMNA
jgi:hypothetical protein